MMSEQEILLILMNFVLESVNSLCFRILKEVFIGLLTLISLTLPLTSRMYVRSRIDTRKYEYIEIDSTCNIKLGRILNWKYWYSCQSVLYQQLFSVIYNY